MNIHASRPRVHIEFCGDEISWREQTVPDTRPMDTPLTTDSPFGEADTATGVVCARAAMDSDLYGHGAGFTPDSARRLRALQRRVGP